MASVVDSSAAANAALGRRFFEEQDRLQGGPAPELCAPDYQAALDEFYGKYVWRKPNKTELDMTLKTVNEQIYNYMQGPSEFTITGTLKTYDATAHLKDVNVPTLYMVGEFDEVGPDLVRSFASRTPGARFFVIPNSAHLFQWDNPDAAIAEMREFLRTADAAPPRTRRTSGAPQN